MAQFPPSPPSQATPPPSPHPKPPPPPLPNPSQPQVKELPGCDSLLEQIEQLPGSPEKQIEHRVPTLAESGVLGTGLFLLGGGFPERKPHLGWFFLGSFS